jgi:hypothetical protein
MIVWNDRRFQYLLQGHFLLIFLIVHYNSYNKAKEWNKKCPEKIEASF